jgi:hypothetical protein
MYYLYVELQHFSQIIRLEPELSRKIFTSIEEECNRRGMQRYPGFEGQLYYHPSMGAGEYEPLLKTMFSLDEFLSEYEEDIPGYVIIVDAIDKDELIVGDITRLRLKTRERRGMYLGSNAEKLISRFLVGEPFRGLWKVFSRKEKDDENLGTATEFAIRRSFSEAVLEDIAPWMNGESTPGIVSFSGSEYDGIHLVPRGLLQRLVSTESAGKLPFAVIHEDEDFYFSLMNSVSLAQTEWISDELSELEAQLWHQKAGILQRLHPRGGSLDGHSSLLPEQLESDVLVGIQMYLKAFSRWSRNNGNLPVVVLYLQRLLEPHEARFLAQLMEDTQKDSRVFWFFTGEENVLPGNDFPLEQVRFELLPYAEEELKQRMAAISERDEQQGYMYNATGGHAMSAYQFLGDYGYFSELLPSRLRNYGNNMVEPREGILHRYLDRIDFDSREILFCLKVAGNILDKEQVFAFFEKRGILRTRITEIFKELQSRGLLMYEQINHVPYQEVLERMAFGLGDRRNMIINELLEYILDPLNGVNPSPGCIRLVVRHAKRPEVTVWIYREILTYIESRHYDRASSLIAALAPIRQGRSAERLLLMRMKLEQGRLRVDEIATDQFPDGFWGAEAKLLLARAYTQSSSFREARDHTKQAIIAFQGLEDRRGIAEANILFGYLLLCESRHQDANHYFSIGERSDTGSSLDANRITSSFLPCISDFSEGKLSRVRRHLEGPDGLVASLYGIGNRSFASAAAFLLARTYFAMGLFQDSYVLLSQMLNILQGEEFIDLRRIFYAWMGRNLVYQNQYQAGLRILENLPRSLETQVYLAEAMILREDYETVLELLSQPADLPVPSGRLALYLPWTTGFSWIEDLFVEDVDKRAVLRNYAVALRGFALGKGEQPGEGRALFHWLTREQKIPPSDPHTSVILFWYSLTLEQAGDDAESEDRLTLLGRAVKALQERSSRIEDPADKREYLKNVIWNRDLLDKAKRFNLV